MTIRRLISTSIRATIISLLLVLTAAPASAQLKFFALQKDSIPVFRGFSVSFDMVGAGMALFGDRGQYEAGLRLNLHDEWFPVVEFGYGRADCEDEVTKIRYKTSAPYFKVGIDRNMLKNKHGDNRLYAGLRYAYTSYKANLSRPGLMDPTWNWESDYNVQDAPCNMHWMEALIALDVKLVGPLHLGWSARYKIRLFHKDGDFGKTWYVPGYGINDSSKFDATFNVIIDI